MPLDIKAKDVLELTNRDDQRTGCDEAGDDRMAEEVGQKAEPRKPHCNQDKSRYQGQDDRRTEILGRSSRREFSDG